MEKQAWLKREVEQAVADVKRWPAWMRNETESKTKSGSRPQPAKPAKK